LEIWQLTATELASSISKGEISAVDATQSHLSRMNEANQKINAVVEGCQGEALREAEQVDANLRKGLQLGPLAGVPVTVKVNVDQEGYATTNGLQLQKDLVAQKDNPVVNNLRKAGAIIIGRTNTPAFSLRWFTRNVIHGHTKNPLNPLVTPGGSSGGAAAAVASGIGAIGHGTDIAGSIRYPAYACGIHGLRPSLGRVAAHNFSGPDRFIGAQLMAVSGPLARSIEDLELGL
jgi:amidase